MGVLEPEQALWTPSCERVAQARIWPLLDLVNQRYDVELPATYGALHRWSVQYPGEFWATVWDHCQVPGERGERLLSAGDRLEHTRFLPEARLNVAEVLLSGWAHDQSGQSGAAPAGQPQPPAISFTAEDGERAQLSGTELRVLVARVQTALRADGVQSGDRVAAVISNRPEGYALMLAAASVGAIFTSVSPDFGVDGIVDRFAQVEPVVLVGVARYFYAGREHDIRPTLAHALAALPSVRRTVIVPAGIDDSRPSDLRGWSTWPDWLAGSGPHPSDDEPSFERFGFDHPWYVLYSSGTTGRPKCIVHRAGGVLLKHLAEHRFQHDLGSGDRLSFFTTAGWMMWNWQASALASGVGLVLYDGSPFHPDGRRLFDLVDAEKVTALGVSPRFLEGCEQAGLRPAVTHRLSSLRTLLVTGSPLSAETARYVYQSVLPDQADRTAPGSVRPGSVRGDSVRGDPVNAGSAQLAPISGGTDLCGVIVGAEPTSAVYPGQMQCAALGMDADVVDAAGRSLAVGERGELVVRTPFPSMPLGFWADDDGTHYRAAYFDRYPGLWHHGDFAERTSTGGYVISGRSDATLNPGGVRIGTAEIYRQVAMLEPVLESAAIGFDHEGDCQVVLFVQLRPGLQLDLAMVTAIRQRIRANLSPRHVPAAVIQAPDLPRTRSGKLSELAVRDVVHGRPVTNTGALANPDCLEFFAGLDLAALLSLPRQSPAT